jgi:predicted dehydrogenase
VVFRTPSATKEVARFDAERPAAIGVVGCGTVFGRYVGGMARFPELRVAGCADLLPERALAAAEEHAVAAYSSVQDLIASSDVDVVVNLTPPSAHAAVTAAALDAGKHVYVEKPMAATLADALRLAERARDAGLLLGSAPDTFLGGANQTARRAIDDGLIGAPIGVAAFVTASKPETWHPDPTFLFQPGAGPALDLGPYYITSIVNLLGPIRAVAGSARIGSPTRVVTSPQRRVESITVTTPTHLSATLEFESGVIGTFLASFDIWDHHLPFIEVYGSTGTLTAPDPNGYDGDVLIKPRTSEAWRALPPVIAMATAMSSTDQSMRGAGVADLVGALNGQPHRASAALACHVLEALEAIETSSRERRVVELATRCDRPAELLARNDDRA